jgi:MYXO-CTERM domain-containing protein
VTEQPVPVPAALPLAATAMFGLGWFARRRRRSA